MAKKKTKNYHWGVRILIVLIVGVALLVSVLFFEKQINKALGLESIQESNYEGVTNEDVLTEVVGEDLVVHFLDVGQGDACIIQFPDYKTMLIDGAENGYGDKINDYIEQNVKDENGDTITYFDYAVLTHSDSDHCASMDEVLNEYPAKTFYRPNVLASREGYSDPNRNLLKGNYTEKSTLAYKNAIEAGNAGADTVIINSADMADVEGESASGEPYSVRFYGPNSDSYKDWNNYSPIMIVEYKGVKMALTGDCEKEGEEEFVNLVNADSGEFALFDDDYHVDVIKAGHHGSRTSTSVPFVNAITTQSQIQNTLVIVSCGFENSYGHPHSEFLNNMKTVGVADENILRTDQNGDIVLSIKADGTLMHGASPIVRTPQKLVDWRYIAISAFVAITLVVFIQPLATVLGIKTDKKKKKS